MTSGPGPNAGKEVGAKQPQGRLVEFWASVENPWMLGKVAESLNLEEGWHVRHRFHGTGAWYRAAQSPCQRFRMRLRIYLGYPLQLAARLLLGRPKPNLIVIASNPFFAPLWASWLGRVRGIPIVHLTLDTYPDALIESGKFRPNSLPVRLIASATRAMRRNCAGTVCIGKRLQQHLEKQYGPARHEQVIPLATPGFQTEFSKNDLESNHPPPPPWTILYCGNLGHLHDTTTLTKALALLNEEVSTKFAFHFHITGTRIQELRLGIEESRKHNPHLNANIAPPLDDKAWEHALHHSPIGLVTMRPGAERVLYPSKTFAAMAAGQAILAITPSQSDLADLIHESKSGWVVEPGNPENLSQLLERLSHTPEEIRQCGLRAREYAQAHLSLKPVSSEWLAYLQRLFQSDKS